MKSHWELNAHSYDQIPMHKLDDQRAVIARTMQVNEKFAGTRPRGWFGPGLTQTDETLDYLAEARVEYIGDWMLDDEPVTLRTSSRPVVALPYNFGIHDIGMMALQHRASMRGRISSQTPQGFSSLTRLRAPPTIAFALPPATPR